MNFSALIPRLFELCQNTSLSFQMKGQEIQNEIASLSLPQLLEHLDSAGIIPECFDHDSTEEKLFAKYCDALLSRAFNELSLRSVVIQERSDSADVCAEGPGYKVVADAKAFRLSRTAKNQKDFKVEALNEWRKGAHFACLVAPIFQFPNRTSQIYSQAVRYNVTFLSFTHVAFLIRNKAAVIRAGLRRIWEFPATLSNTQDAEAYWSGLNTLILSITNKSPDDFKKAVQSRMARLKDQAGEQVSFWIREEQRISRLPHDEAVSQLISALKIEEKIATIQKSVK